MIQLEISRTEYNFNRTLKACRRGPDRLFSASAEVFSIMANDISNCFIPHLKVAEHPNLQSITKEITLSAYALLTIAARVSLPNASPAEPRITLFTN